MPAQIIDLMTVALALNLGIRQTEEGDENPLLNKELAKRVMRPGFDAWATYRTACTMLSETGPKKQKIETQHQTLSTIFVFFAPATEAMEISSTFRMLWVAIGLCFAPWEVTNKSKLPVETATDPSLYAQNTHAIMLFGESTLDNHFAIAAKRMLQCVKILIQLLLRISRLLIALAFAQAACIAHLMSVVNFAVLTLFTGFAHFLYAIKPETNGCLKVCWYFVLVVAMLATVLACLTLAPTATANKIARFAEGFCKPGSTEATALSWFVWIVALVVAAVMIYLLTMSGVIPALIACLGGFLALKIGGTAILTILSLGLNNIGVLTTFAQHTISTLQLLACGIFSMFTWLSKKGEAVTLDREMDQQIMGLHMVQAGSSQTNIGGEQIAKLGQLQQTRRVPPRRSDGGSVTTVDPDGQLANADGQQAKDYGRLFSNRGNEESHPSGADYVYSQGSQGSQP